MGGNVFMSSAAEGQPSLRTPRMDPITYQTLKEQYIKLLWTLLPNSRSITTAIEAPEKPEIHIRTDKSDVTESVRIITEYLTENKFI